MLLERMTELVTVSERQRRVVGVACFSTDNKMILYSQPPPLSWGGGDRQIGGVQRWAATQTAGMKGAGRRRRSVPRILVRRPTFLASLSQTLEPVSCEAIHWDLERKRRRKGGKQAAHLAPLRILAVRSEPAPLQVYSQPKMRGAQSFSLPAGLLGV